MNKEILLSNLEIGKIYEPLKFPGTQVKVISKNSKGIFMRRLLFLPEKNLYYEYKTFNGSYGQENCLFKLLN